ncbi:uncharacterized protein LOC105420065 [Amborella trichopoda]|uniref:uncharacterized protein LOC105420065 n=1 Tax=Amborella trichopoda TaxID=13333 RepID=UPI0005D41F3E|nr:uncharacterized protein LOC105420065 [Amborella trichopoda]|eukprot:XP_011620519.1 uncharacterized protein LOC105420065 [Amborella trichopoda]
MNEEIKVQGENHVMHLISSADYVENKLNHNIQNEGEARNDEEPQETNPSPSDPQSGTQSSSKKRSTPNNGTIESYRVRLFAKGFTQTYVEDYKETFAPVDKVNTIRVLFSIATNYDWPLYQLDVKNVFLQGDLEEFLKDILMKIPILCANSYMFVKKGENGSVVVLVYVDDIIVIRDDAQGIIHLKNDLHHVFDLKDLGKLRYLWELKGLIQTRIEKPITSFCTFVDGNIITWKSKKQNVVARSSTEAEYRVMASTACELIWHKALLQELGF